MDGPIITTSRLRLRQWKADDIKPLVRLNQDNRVMEYFPSTRSREESLSFIERNKRQIEEAGYGWFAVERLDNQEFIGFIGLSNASFEAFFTPCVEIGWRLHHEHWGQGFATEGALACLEYGFQTLELKEIYSFTAAINHRSERVMIKIGMRQAGIFDHPHVPEGSPLRRHVLYRTDSLIL